MGGRAPSRCAAVAARADESVGKICGRFAKDFIGLFEVTHFALQSLRLLGLFGSDPATLPRINPDLLNPFVQGLPRTAEL